MKKISFIIISSFVVLIAFVEYAYANDNNTPNPQTSFIDHHRYINREPYYKLFKKTLKNAENGNANAQADIGILLLSTTQFDEEKRSQDRQNAFEWLKKSAMQGNVNAKYAIGIMYKNGISVEKDENLAFNWFKGAALAGHNKSQFEIGKMYKTGKRKNTSKAFYWMQKAAKNDNTIAAYELSFMFAQGIGVRRNEEKAMEWMLNAALRGNVKAHKTLQFLLRGMK